MKGGKLIDTILDYDGLIYSIISKYPKKYDYNDMHQAGLLGLVEAYKHYDPSANTKFSTFAYYYIVGEVNNYIRQSSNLKLSKELISLKKKILKVTDLMTQKLGRKPTTEELSLYLDVSIEDIDKAIISDYEPTSIQATYDTIKSPDNINDEIIDLRCEIEKLPEEDKKLIIERYYNDLTQSETSKKLGISQVQVSRNEAKILKKLRNKL